MALKPSPLFSLILHAFDKKEFFWKDELAWHRNSLKNIFAPHFENIRENCESLLNCHRIALSWSLSQFPLRASNLSENPTDRNSKPPSSSLPIFRWLLFASFFRNSGFIPSPLQEILFFWESKWWMSVGYCPFPSQVWKTDHCFYERYSDKEFLFFLLPPGGNCYSVRFQNSGPAFSFPSLDDMNGEERRNICGFVNHAMSLQERTSKKKPLAPITTFPFFFLLTPL